MTPNDNRRLFRSQDSIIAGVCAGVAEYFGLDVSLVRIATLLLILFGGTLAVGLHHPLADRP